MEGNTITLILRNGKRENGNQISSKIPYARSPLHARTTHISNCTKLKTTCNLQCNAPNKYKNNSSHDRPITHSMFHRLLFIVYYLLLTTYYLLLTTYYLLLTTYYLLLTTCYLLIATCNLLVASCYLLLATRHSLLVTCYLLLATCYLLHAT